MNASGYHPRPIDSTAVHLTPDLTALTEKLAENAHDMWAQERQAQGWTWGEERNDTLKKHPCLIGYAELPDSEKKFDRETAMGTLKALMAIGATIEAPPLPPTPAEDAAADAWQAWLGGAMDAIEKEGSHQRGWDFDMDDQPELDSGKLAEFPSLQKALFAFQTSLAPLWRAHDQEANALQKTHRKVARMAIIPGVLAILLAIVQLSLTGSPKLEVGFSMVELVAAIIASVGVGWGFYSGTRDRWLTARQAAERLRVVKFRALADPLLWCDYEKWESRWLEKIKALNSMSFKQAEHWVHGGHAEPAIPGIPVCLVPTGEARAIADYYRIKRQRYQGHYFATKAREHQRDTWLFRLRLPVFFFFLSVLFVIIHAVFEAPEMLSLMSGELNGQSTDHGAELSWVVALLLALAAALPVLGFGLRAWFSAFELPRRAQLFEGKAAQLRAALQQVEADRLHPRKVFTHIEMGEHFFENEHREWCRLILEAEWFV